MLGGQELKHITAIPFVVDGVQYNASVPVCHPGPAELVLTGPATVVLGRPEQYRCGAGPARAAGRVSWAVQDRAGRPVSATTILPSNIQQAGTEILKQQSVAR